MEFCINFVDIAIIFNFLHYAFSFQMFPLSYIMQRIIQSFNVFEETSFFVIIYALQSGEIVTSISLSPTKVLSYNEESISQRKA